MTVAPAARNAAPLPALVRWVPWLLIGTGVIHALYGAVMISLQDPNPFRGIAADGFLNTVSGHEDRALAVWFLATAVPVIVLMPTSGGWLVLIVAGLALAAARKTPGTP